MPSFSQQVFNLLMKLTVLTNSLILEIQKAGIEDLHHVLFEQSCIELPEPSRMYTRNSPSSSASTSELTFIVDLYDV